MATPYLTPDAIPPTDRVCYRIRIPNTLEFVGAVKTALLSLTHGFNWEPYGASTPEECVRAAIEMYDEFMNDKGWCMIGAIYPYASATPPASTLLCDGTTYNRVDYPQLYAALNSAFIVNADQFIVPDLRARVGVGAGAVLAGFGTLTVGQTGGEAQHALSISELASHSHTTQPHSHTESAASPTVLDISVGVPAPAALPSASVTGTAAPTTDSSGSGTAHNNVQPFIALNYCIVAR